MRLNHDLIKTKNGVRTCADVLAISNENKSYKTIGKINLFFQDTATFSLLQFGDEIIIQSKINEIQSAMNPYEFDSKKFYGLKKIYFQTCHR